MYNKELVSTLTSYVTNKARNEIANYNRQNELKEPVHFTKRDYLVAFAKHFRPANDPDYIWEILKDTFPGTIKQIKRKIDILRHEERQKNRPARLVFDYSMFSAAIESEVIAIVSNSELFTTDDSEQLLAEELYQRIYPMLLSNGVIKFDKDEKSPEFEYTATRLVIEDNQAVEADDDGDSSEEDWD